MTSTNDPAARAYLTLDALCDDPSIADALRDIMISLDDRLTDDDIAFLTHATDSATTFRTLDAETIYTCRTLLSLLDTHTRTLLYLAHSLCPLHATDYAICFDDDDPACASIRALYPSHDT